MSVSRAVRCASIVPASCPTSRRYCATLDNAKARLHGVVFDMDGTLTVPNLDFAEMYRRCGVSMNEDILCAVSKMQPAQSADATAIIEEMEAEGARTLELMPGTVELARWLADRGVPTAIVTRNSASTLEHFLDNLWLPAGLAAFSPAISRDGEVITGGNTSTPLPPLPAKPDPAALLAITAKWGIQPGPSVLMVGDSPSNDIAFGIAAGVSTALLDTGRRYAEGGVGTNVPDYNVQNLSDLIGLLNQHYAFSS